MHEGKEVKYYDGIERDVIVAGCEYDVGITLVAKEDKERILLCILNPNVFIKRTKLTVSEKIMNKLWKSFDSIFTFYSEKIEEGYIDETAIKLPKRFTTGYTSVPQSACPFR